MLFLIGMAFLALLLFCFRMPVITGKLTGQTIYLSILNSFHFKDDNAEACCILVDDDTGNGIYKIREICRRVGVKATFAVVPTFLDSARCDSLRKWHDEGYGIALHGYDHGKWKDWTEDEIKSDIDKSLDFLRGKGFSGVEQIQLVVSPSFYNTVAIRRAVKSKGMKLVVGANIVNPDTAVFQWGRLFLRNNADMKDIYDILVRAKHEKGNVVIGTHSSMDDEFSYEKTEETLRMAVALGFKFY